MYPPHPKFETGIDGIGEDVAPLPRPRRRITVPTWLTSPDTWIAVAAIVVVLSVVIGAVLLLWWLVSWLLQLLGTLGGLLVDGGEQTGRWLAGGPITSTITGPIRAYLEQHAAGLPATAGQLWWTWLAVTAALFLAAWCGSRGGRIGWTLIGAATTAMVWAGADPAGRELAAGVTVAVWALLSVLAFTGAGRTQVRTVVVHPPNDRADAAASTDAATA